MGFHTGKQVFVVVRGFRRNGYIYAKNEDNTYQVGYWDSDSETEKICLSVNESSLSDKICEHTGRVCGVVTTAINPCKTCRCWQSE